VNFPTLHSTLQKAYTINFYWLTCHNKCRNCFYCDKGIKELLVLRYSLNVERDVIVTQTTVPKLKCVRTYVAQYDKRSNSN